jgi:hypothetical protein
MGWPTICRWFSPPRKRIARRGWLPAVPRSTAAGAPGSEAVPASSAPSSRFSAVSAPFQSWLPQSAYHWDRVERW